MAADEDNEEDKKEDDIHEKDGDYVLLILENADEHAIKRQLC